MKFSDHLSVHLTPEWRKQYINYKALKDVLYEAADKSFAPEDCDASTIQRHYSSCIERFFHMCEKEITKVNIFHSEKLSEAQRRFTALEAELDLMTGAQEEDGSTLFNKKSFHRLYRARHKSLSDLKLAFSELYLSLVLLQNYQNLNFTGFEKITEKHDELFGTQRGLEWRVCYVDTSPFSTSTKTDQLIQEVETLFTNRLEQGDRQKAMKRLRVPPLGTEQPVPVWITFRVGMFSGLIIAFCLLIIITVCRLPRVTTVWPLLRFYRGGFLIVEFFLFWGINYYGWRKAGVNHILIFELDPRDHLSYLQLFEIAGFLGVTWCVSVLSCLYSQLFPIPLQVNPLAFYSFLLLLLLNPTKTFYYKSRMWLLKLMYKVATAPLHRVGFADFWLADQLNSLTPVFVDFWSLCCFYIFDMNWRNPYVMNLHPKGLQCANNSPGVRRFIQCIPTWIRFAQCLRRYWDSNKLFPHIVNAGKYATVFIMVTFAAVFSSEKVWPRVNSGETFYFYGWVLAACAGTVFTTVWDLKMDWGLLEVNAQNKFLRDEMVYTKKASYMEFLPTRE
ncbi:xenotropic and polytropic retrovirus receptor 1 homolog isoform X3 [Hyla sarda]|uniref:xenotropic and polytropic retrovirus receptor 1 homolog isoform X3 n=1 Tax=Hyla sarda TaxID=327740 RepID=UPI0024C2993A|nr:xenotropic and polytropic retrovirus receptor 1 homolog isoform X3 [Hyla sarda]